MKSNKNYSEREGRKKLKRIFKVALPAGILSAVLFIILIFSYAQAAEPNLEIPIYHHHTDACMGDVTELKEADGEKYLRTISESTCPVCGGVVHDYLFTADCSCGEHIERTGWACYHSMYGTEPAGCPTYSEVDFNTEHEHTERKRICNLEETDTVGKIGILISETKPAKNLTLKASYEGRLAEPEFAWHLPDGKSLQNNILLVKENGVYTLVSEYCEDGEKYEVSRDVVITNIDTDGPEILKVEADNEKPTNQPVKIIVTAKDLQAGLADCPYSINGGISQKESIFYAEKNGTYQIAVFDSLGNISREKITVSNIDLKPPVLTLSKSPELWEEGECVITVSATDSGSGLSDKPYSFDGGKTWTRKNSISLTKSQTVEVLARDEAGNIAKESMNAELKEKKAEPEKTEGNTKEKTKEKTEETTKEKTKTAKGNTEETSEKESDEVRKANEEENSSKTEEQEKSDNLQIGSVLPGTVIIEGNGLTDSGKNRKNENENKKQDIKKQENKKTENDKAKNDNTENESAEIENNLNGGYEEDDDNGSETEKPEENNPEIENGEMKEIPEKVGQYKKKAEIFIQNFRIGFMKIPGEIRVLGITTSALAGGAGVFFAGFFLLGSAGINWVDRNGKEHFLCRNIIHRRGEIYELRVDKRNLQSSETKDIRIHLPALFSKLHRYRPLTIRFENTTVSQYVEKDISLKLP